MRHPLPTLMAAISLAFACSSPASPTTTTSSTSAASSSVPAMYAKFTNGTSVSLSGSSVVLSSKGVPDHTSPYWGVGNALYEAPQAGMTVNPNLIATQNFVITVPASPSLTTTSDTPLGAIGMATNGVALFNQYAAGRQPLTTEIISFDRWNGHPQQTGQYHYHFEPLWLTKSDKAALIGVLLDGFPIYGPEDSDGTTPADLDSCNGHTHATTDFPNGIYHYHATPGVPYLSGCFHGSAGTTSSSMSAEYRSDYANGRIAELRHFVGGHEAGLQQAWTPEGVLFLNYEVRDGRRYGLVNSKPCLPTTRDGL